MKKLFIGFLLLLTIQVSNAKESFDPKEVQNFCDMLVILMNTAQNVRIEKYPKLIPKETAEQGLIIASRKNFHSKKLDGIAKLAVKLVYKNYEPYEENVWTAKDCVTDFENKVGGGNEN